MPDPPVASRRRVRAAPGVLAVLLLAALAAVDALGREGARVASWSPAPLGWPWFVAWVLAAWLASGRGRRARSARPARLALAAALCVVALAGLSSWRSNERGRVEGLAARVARPSAPQARAEAVALTTADLATPRALARRLGRRGDVELRASGFLTLPEAGPHRFKLACGGACALWVGGREIARASGSADATAADVTLPAGPRPLRLELIQPASRAWLELTWDRPARLELLPLSAAVGPRPLDPGAFQRRERLVAWRLGAVVVATTLLWIALLGLVPWMIDTAAPFVRATRDVAWRALLADRVRLQAALVFLAAAAFLAGLRVGAAPRALVGGYLHAWTSEYMMQTVSVADLRAEPLRSLLYLHVQPPLFDALRAALAALHPDLDGDALMQAVDQGLYAGWGLAYGVAAALTFVWLAPRFGAVAGLGGAALFALHPASIFYATFLDSTFVSALGLLWLVFELSRLGPGRGSATRVAAALILLFLTRSIVQWPFLPVAGASLWLLACERRRGLRALLAFAVVMALYLGKQYALFGLTITSSFGPDSFCKGLSAYCHGTTPVPLPPLPEPGAASVLRRTEKLNGEYNYNQLAFLKRSFAQMEEYRTLLRATPPDRLVALMAHNVAIWLRPSSRHSAHVVVDGLPWRGAFDRVFSGGALAALLAAAGALWLARARRSPAELRRGLALALPCLYVAATSIAFESGENMRYKFFVEPVLLVFVCWQACAAVSLAASRRRRAPANAADGAQDPTVQVPGAGPGGPR